MKTFNIYTTNLSEDSKGILSGELVEVLAPMLEEDFCKKTSLELSKDLWFFLLALNVIKVSNKQYRLQGTIVGPNSVAIDSEAIWEVKTGGKITASWVSLDTETFIQEFGNTTPLQLDIPETSFPVKWVFAWEAHLPDFYIEIKFENKISALIEESYLTRIEQCAPDYSNLKKESEAILSIHTAVIGGEKLHSILHEALSLTEQIHLTNKVELFQIGQ